MIIANTCQSTQLPRKHNSRLHNKIALVTTVVNGKASKTMTRRRIEAASAGMEWLDERVVQICIQLMTSSSQPREHLGIWL